MEKTLRIRFNVENRQKMSAGQIAAKEASKAAQREKELASFSKKQERKDKQW
jgi:hypothetical protein